MDIHHEPTVSDLGDNDDTLKDFIPVHPPPTNITGNDGNATSGGSSATPRSWNATGGQKGGFSRRKVLGLTALGLAGAGVVAGGGTVLAELWQSGAWRTVFGGAASNQQIGHLLRRVGFGARPEEMKAYSALGFQGAVERLLDYKQASDDALESRLKGLNLDLTKPAAQQQWWLLRMIWSQRPLLEKMTLFWHGLLVSSFRKVGGPNAYMRMIIQNQFFRDHAFDTFDTILLGITGDPAMLFYLDLAKSKKNTPNENYARELMELFTLGLGNYSQQDVWMGASALTGWRLTGSALKATYVPAQHNTGTKTFLGHSGNLDYRDVVHILTNHPAAPWFLSRKLFTFFVYENPSKEDLQPLVDAYNKSNHNMGEVMRALLLSPQFSSAKAYRSRVKSPAEFVIGTYRALGLEGDARGLPAMTTAMGQTLFDPPNVAGWPGDKVSALWLNSGTWMSRLNYIDLLLVGGRNQRTGVDKPLDLQGVITANHIDSPEHFVDYFAAFLLDGQLEQDRRDQLVAYFTTQDRTGQRGGGVEIMVGGKAYALGRVRGTLYLLLALPEYQLN